MLLLALTARVSIVSSWCLRARFARRCACVCCFLLIIIFDHVVCPVSCVYYHYVVREISEAPELRSSKEPKCKPTPTLKCFVDALLERTNISSGAPQLMVIFAK